MTTPHSILDQCTSGEGVDLTAALFTQDNQFVLASRNGQPVGEQDLSKNMVKLNESFNIVGSMTANLKLGTLHKVVVESANSEGHSFSVQEALAVPVKNSAASETGLVSTVVGGTATPLSEVLLASANLSAIKSD